MIAPPEMRRGMSRKPSIRISTEASGEKMVGLGGLLSGLDTERLPEEVAETAQSFVARKNGRVVIRKEKSGRGGKVVLVLDQFATHLTVPFLEKLLVRLQKACGCGGAIRGRALELQGDQVERVRKALEMEGFTVGGITQ